MRFLYRHWWFGLTLSCGCVGSLDGPKDTIEARGQAPVWQKVERAPESAAVPVVALEVRTPDSAIIPVAAPEKLPEPKPLPERPLPPLKPPDAPPPPPLLAMPEAKPLPINLATALQLLNARAWDIAIAAESVRSAAAQFQQAAVLWAPTLISGIDFQHHDGTVQNTDGSLFNGSRNNFMVGMAPLAAFATTDAIFEPLAARQIEQARRRQLQAATNDTTADVAVAYFNVQEARGDLAGARDTLRRTQAMLNSIESMAPALVPMVEVSRARAQLARFRQDERSARERWDVASAELVRILRMDPTAVLEPIEPPNLMITLIPPNEPSEQLLSVAVLNRPELAAFRNLTQAAEQRWREERFRPFIPTIFARGNANQLPDSFGFGYYGGGSGSNISNFGLRDDFEVQAVWELRNLGFGNRAIIRQRQAEFEASRMQTFRTQDLIAREVAQAAAQLRSAYVRVRQAEGELREAIQSANDNFVGLTETKRISANINIVVIRPQEAMASVIALLQAYFDYYGTVADYNRAEFRLYRALGNPAQALVDPNGPFADACKTAQGVMPQQPGAPLVGNVPQAPAPMPGNVPAPGPVMPAPMAEPIKK
jgi:outer membrane protein TolC